MGHGTLLALFKSPSMLKYSKMVMTVIFMYDSQHNRWCMYPWRPGHSYLPYSYVGQGFRHVAGQDEDWWVWLWKRCGPFWRWAGLNCLVILENYVLAGKAGWQHVSYFDDMWPYLSLIYVHPAIRWVWSWVKKYTYKYELGLMMACKDYTCICICISVWIYTVQYWSHQTTAKHPA